MGPTCDRSSLISSPAMVHGVRGALRCRIYCSRCRGWSWLKIQLTPVRHPWRSGECMRCRCVLSDGNAWNVSLPCDPTDSNRVNYLCTCIALNLMLIVCFNINPLEKRESHNAGRFCRGLRCRVGALVCWNVNLSRHGRADRASSSRSLWLRPGPRGLVGHHM